MKQCTQTWSNPFNQKVRPCFFVCFQTNKKRKSCCAERIYWVKGILRHNRLCQSEPHLIPLHRRKKKLSMRVVAFFFPTPIQNCQVTASEKNKISRKKLFLSDASNTKIMALHKVCLMYFLSTPLSSPEKKKVCLKFKRLSQEQSLTPILFKWTSLPSFNRHWAQKKNIKNPCT